MRLLDSLREDTEQDLGASDADRIVRAIEEWARRSGSERLPRPPLKSDGEDFAEISLPLHLDELLLLPDVTEELYYDQVLDGRVLRGLESVLTIWTAMQFDPGDPEKMARLAAQRGEPAPQPSGQAGGANDPNAPAQQPLGEGILININFASRPVLRALMPEAAIPDSVIDAILRYRNEPDPDAQEEDGGIGATAYDFGGLELGGEQKLRVFTTVDDLDNVEEFADLADPEVKSSFKSFCTTKSDVFSVHLATMFRRNEENRVFVIRRARSILMRRDDGSNGKLHPILRWEERHGLRVLAPDLQDDPDNRVMDLTLQYSEMDAFAQEDRAWNPFLVDFYLPKWQRDQLLKR